MNLNRGLRDFKRPSRSKVQKGDNRRITLQVRVGSAVGSKLDLQDSRLALAQRQGHVGWNNSGQTVRPSNCKISLRQASLCRATKQLMPTPRGRRPPPTQGGGSGLSHYVFRGAMTGRCLASGGGEAEETGHCTSTW